MSLCIVTVLLWALRPCAVSRQSCHGQRGDNGYREGAGQPASKIHAAANLKTQNPTFKAPHSKFKFKFKTFKTGLTSPHPQSPRQTQTGCWRQLMHGRRLGFVPTRRGGKFDWLQQGSSWADSLRGNHSIQFKLEKQFVSEAKSFLRQDSQAVLAVPREGTSF